MQYSWRIDRKSGAESRQPTERQPNQSLMSWSEETARDSLHLSESPSADAFGHPRRQAIVVLGMHRSGTSALARILSLCGAALPKRLMAPEPAQNAAGFWESRVIAQLNDDFFAAVGRQWHDCRALPRAAFASAQAAEFGRRARRTLAIEFGQAPLCVIKDPRLCLLAPLWAPVLKQGGLAAKIVIPVRNPLEVADSLAKREVFSQRKSLLLWLRYVLCAERASRGARRCFVTYEQILERPIASLRRVDEVLDIGWPRAPNAAAPEIEAFLAPSLRHHVRSPSDVLDNPRQSSWTREAYRWLRQAARGEEAPVDALDQIAAELEWTEARLRFTLERRSPTEPWNDADCPAPPFMLKRDVQGMDARGS